MATIHPIVTERAVDAAWNEYSALCIREREDPALSHDRAHVEARIRAHDRFTQLFLANERRDNVVRMGGRDA